MGIVPHSPTPTLQYLHTAMPCLFCQIASNKVPATLLYHDELVTAFRDIHPQAPVHILIIPNQHLEGVAAVTVGHSSLLTALFTTAVQLAAQEGLAADGYRLQLAVDALLGEHDACFARVGAGGGKKQFHTAG